MHYQHGPNPIEKVLNFLNRIENWSTLHCELSYKLCTENLHKKWISFIADQLKFFILNASFVEGSFLSLLRALTL